jgi:hypothetical protein
MDYLLKKKREKIEAEAEKLFGDNILLKTVYILTELKSPQEEIEETLAVLKEQESDNAKEYEMGLQLTLDSSGNIVERIPAIEISPDKL